MKMTKRVILAVALVAATSALQAESPSEAKLMKEATVTRSQAEKVAVAKVPHGTIKSGDGLMATFRRAQDAVEAALDAQAALQSVDHADPGPAPPPHLPETCLEQLRELRCDFVQGYLMSGPLRRRTLETWLQESPWGLGNTAAELVEIAE